MIDNSSNRFLFRAWHNDLKRMLYAPNPVDSMICIRMDSKNGPHWKINGEMVSAHMTWDGRLYVNGVSQNLTWLQCTGVQDIQGKDIYEGDLIINSDMDKAQQVKFEIGAFGIYLDEFTFEPLMNINECDNVIIGNIYQNPELLTIK